MGCKNCQHVLFPNGHEVYLSQIWVFLSQLGCESDQQDCSSRALDHTLSRVLLDHLDQAHAVARAHLVEQANGVVLRHVVCARLERCVRAAAEPAQEAAARLAS
jgi:hypothetical protein